MTRTSLSPSRSDAEKHDGDLTGSRKARLISILWKKPFLMAMVLFAILTLVASTLTAVLHATHPQEGDVAVSGATAAIGIQQDIVVAISMVALIFQAAHELRHSKQQDEEQQQSAKSAPKKTTTVDTPGISRMCKKLRQISVYDVIVAVLLFLNLFSIIIAIVQICSTTTPFPNGVKLQVRIATGDIISVCLHAIFCICACLTIWWPLTRVARRCLFAIALVQIIIGILIEELNFREVLGPPMKNGYEFRENNGIERSSYSRLSYSLYVGSIEVAIGLLTIGLCWVTNSSNRLSSLIRRFVLFFVVCSLFSLIFVVISCILSLTLIYNTNSGISDTTAYANVGLSWTAFCLHIAALVATNYLQARPNSHLEVEEFDLNSLNSAQVQAFATLIDHFGKSSPGAPSGPNAMSMMQAYSAVNIPGLRCKVLRVYKPAAMDKNEDNNGNNSGNKSSKNKLLDYYTQKEFRNLDKPNTIPSDKEIELDSLSHTSSATLSASTDNVNKGLSKNKMKKLMRKQGGQDKNAKKRGSIPFPLENPVSAEELVREVEFNEKLMMTEALVLLSIVDEYDLTTSHDSKFYRLLNVTLGGGSKIKWFRPLCVRLGLLAFHWPFRQSTFFCSPTKRPAARSAAIMRAVAEWNHKLPRRQKCKILLDPLYYNDVSERAIEPAGWSRVPLPPTHIVDLRPYRGKSIGDYLKDIKYRSQSGAFQRAHGEVIETTDFSPENCAEVMRLWRNIAEKRTTDGNTAVLVDPTVDLFRTLGEGKHNTNGYRSLLFLRVNGVNIASCVLFRLGDTITSDLQGLDHETSRQYKAYFVMMQESIQIALKEGISFVDFGPTTAKPKMDIGCKSVPEVGSIYSVSTLINWSMGMFAKNVELNN